MSVKPSAASLPWFWVIELLSSCKELDTSLLNELIFRTPNILDPLAKNARERVTLRCLEGLFDVSTSKDVSFALNSKEESHLSVDCEEIIRRMDCAMPMSTSDIIIAANLEPFIKHKRATLPPFALQQLKDKTHRRAVNVSSSNTETRVVRDDLLVTSIPEISNNDSLEDPKIRNSEPLRRDKIGLPNVEVDHHNAKKLNVNLRNEVELLEEPSESGTGNIILEKIETVGFMNNEDRNKKDIGFQENSPSVEPSMSNNNAQEVSNGIVQCIIPDTSSDSSAEYQNAEFEISRKKAVFFSETQCTLDTDGFTEGNICMKCNKRGQILICIACPLVVHERCLGFSPHFTDEGSFFCPFCDYSRAVSDYLEFKKKTMRARKELSAFIRGAQIQPTKPNHSKRLRKNGSRRNRVMKDEQNVVGDLINGEMGDVHDQSASRKGQVDGGNEDIDVEMVEETELGGERELHVDSNCKVDGVAKRASQCADDRNEAIMNNSEEISESISDGENDIVTTSAYSMRVRRQGKHYTYPTIPLLRRKKIPWNPSEEEMLKVGVQRFSSPGDKSVPWKMILEFGESVFLKGRTTIDLKDKWRNMCKKVPK